jgi:hypothetical protein
MEMTDHGQYSSPFYSYQVLTCFRSLFTVQIGSKPARDLRLFPSTSLGMSFPISPKGCPLSYNTSDDRTCADSRGGVYSHTDSRSYEIEGVYSLDTYDTFSGFGFPFYPVQMGWDDITFGFHVKSGRASSTPSTLIGEMAMWNYTWLGLLGLDPKPTNLSRTRVAGMMEPLPSMIERLVSSGIIPSRSWAYTAGSRWCKQLPTHPTRRTDVT